MQQIVEWIEPNDYRMWLKAHPCLDQTPASMATTRWLGVLRHATTSLSLVDRNEEESGRTKTPCEGDWQS
jgi:hypothetical protein